MFISTESEISRKNMQKQANSRKIKLMKVDESWPKTHPQGLKQRNTPCGVF